MRILACCLLGICVAASPAAGTSGHGPRYTLKIVEGATTLPEYEPRGSVSVGLENRKRKSPADHPRRTRGRPGLGQERQRRVDLAGPQVGDEVVLESPMGTVI